MKIISKKHIIFGTLFLIYMIIVFSYSFFQKSNLNKVLSTKIFLLHLYSFSIIFGFIISIISVVILIVMLYMNRYSYRNILFMGWIGILILSVILIIFGSDTKTKGSTLNTTHTVKIVEWNTANNIDGKNIYTIFGEFDADIAVLPELEGYEKGDISQQRLKDLFSAANLDFGKYESFVSLSTEGSIAPVTIIIKKGRCQFSNNKKVPMTRFGTIYLKSDSEQIPSIVGLHTAPPLPGLIDIWKKDLELISYDIVKEQPDAIIIGDFNATMRHGALNDIITHEDVLNSLSIYNRGTWNVKLPYFFRTSIDHILIPKNQYLVKNIEVKNLYNSDHMAIFAEIQRIE
ncbi:endonuclease/exonuclease/phosphatase family protein [Filifactor alocis]|uniref:endonuclease/exonuclease/phosphatase family protein n=1 Tax=Filifactor alocis TaxID=143361 RepID=UPI0028D22F0A|nr:endonuclease/exonuclease/phosphatase family protein [Filifactor alocis]